MTYPITPDDTIHDPRAANDPVTPASSQALLQGITRLFQELPKIILNGAIALIKELTGLDLSGVETFFDSFTQMLGLDQALNFIHAVLQPLVDAIISILGPIPFLGDAVKTLAGFLGLTHTTANTAQTTAAAATTTQSQQTIAKPNYLAMDATADAVFPISQLNGSTASTIGVTAASSLVGFIATPDNGKKSSIIWLGGNTTNVTGLYINLYELSTTTGVCTLIEASTNLVSSVGNAMAWNYYDLVTPITSEVTHVYAAEIVVTGTGTYQIAGLPSDWKPANTNVIPQQLGAARTTSLVPAPSTFTPSYSGVVPWFGLGGFAFAGPLASEFTAPGTTTYTLPNWLKYGDNVDVVAVGGGGGGAAAFGPIPAGGGHGGAWATATLIYGVDIPTSAPTLSITVGAGGGGMGGSFGGNGFAGGASVVSTSSGTLTATGGAGGGNGPDTTGFGPGNVTYNTVTYTGGANAINSAPGNGPGGGGSGGGSYTGGISGAAGAVWITCYQAGTNP